MQKRIGFASLGLMGAHIAENLVKRGFPLSVGNRTPGKAAGLVGAGAREAKTPLHLAEQPDCVVACVADAAAVEEIVFAYHAFETASDAIMKLFLERRLAHLIERHHIVRARSHSRNSCISTAQKVVLHRSRMNPFLDRNFEAMDPLAWLARLVDHIPDTRAIPALRST